MDQPALFYESLNEVLAAVVTALGGKKVVASVLWPEKPVEEAARYLADCLNSDRPAKLDPEKLLLLLKLARGKGIHLAMTWISEDAGYAPPQPTEPQDEYAELQRQFIRAAETVEAIAKRMERTRMKAVG